MSRLGDRCMTAAFAAAWATVAFIPASWAFGVARLGSRWLTRSNGEGVRRLRQNLQLACPDLGGEPLERAVIAGMESYARYWCTAFRLHRLTPAALERCVTADGQEPVRAALDAGSSVICFLGHLGNWDLAGAWSAHFLAPVTTVAERLRPEEIFQQFLTYRQRLGMTVFPLTGESQSAFVSLRAACRAGGALVPLLADRDLTGSGVPVRWGEEQARAAVGPAALALGTGCPLFPVTVHEVPDAGCPETGGYRLHIVFHPQVEVPRHGATREKVAAMTQSCVDVVSTAVREHPADWHMLQPFFSVPEGG